MSEYWELPDPITFLEGLLPGNPFLGEPPLPRGLLALLEEPEDDSAQANAPPEEAPALASDEAGKPGCTAAETTILTLGFLDGLADGYGGFGVLRQGLVYLEKGATAAESLGHMELAHQLRDIAQELNQVRTPQQAKELADRLRPLKAETWKLGRECHRLVLVGTDAIIALAERVAQGEISLQDAKEMLKDAS